MLQQFCDRGIWLDHGQVMMQGEIGEVIAAYDGKRTMAHS
jgi:ABC-type polysaccharide/polyol phosphate transport system ATPase subunit